MFIVFSTNEEVIVTTSDLEMKTIDEFFTHGGRDLDEYDRDEVNDVAIYVKPSLKWR